MEDEVSHLKLYNQFYEISNHKTNEGLDAIIHSNDKEVPMASPEKNFYRP